MANSFLESLRAAISYAERAQNAELLGAFQKALLEGQDVIDANLKLRDEMRTLREQVTDLENTLRLSEQMKWIHGLYHIISDDGAIGPPYCPLCWEVNKLVVHLHWTPAQVSYRCNNCGKGFPYVKRIPTWTSDVVKEEHTRTPSLSDFAAAAAQPHRRG